MARSIRAIVSMKIESSHDAIPLWEGVSDPLDCPWDERWEKLLGPWELSSLKSGGSQLWHYLP